MALARQQSGSWQHSTSLRPEMQSCWCLRKEESRLMPLQTEELALHVVRALYDATEGRPHQRASLTGMFGATDEAVQHTVDQGWVIVEDGRNICLTEHGRQRAELRSLDGRSP